MQKAVGRKTPRARRTCDAWVRVLIYHFFAMLALELLVDCISLICHL